MIHGKFPVRPKRKLHTRLLQKAAFCFDYAEHLLWHCFHKLMQFQSIYYHQEMHSFLAKILY